jgi:hypothetical protein
MNTAIGVVSVLWADVCLALLKGDITGELNFRDSIP